MLVDFESLPETARIWIYQSNRSFSDIELEEISIKLNHFLKIDQKEMILNAYCKLLIKFNIITKLLFISDYNDFTNAFKIYNKNSLLKTFPLVSESFNIFLEIIVYTFTKLVNF